MAQGYVWIIQNLVCNNVAPRINGLGGCGGGICFFPYSTSGICKVIGNSITNNTAECRGGGIDVYQLWATDSILIENNEVCFNIGEGVTEEAAGAGMGFVSQGGGGGIPLTPAKVVGNIFANNTFSSFGGYGGGIFYSLPLPYNFGWIALRRNEIRGNEDCGIFVSLCWDTEVIFDLGTLLDPGYNAFIDNEEFNFYFNCIEENSVNAIVNYWQSIHTPDVRAGIHLEPLATIYFDPIAASDLVASVTHNSQCSTDVIVTGDLTVDADVNLTIAPGKTFMFDTTDDCASNHPECELIVRGTLEADGTESEKIHFVSFNPVAQAGEWYGIWLPPYTNSSAIIDNCIIRFAYCGIDADEGSYLLSVDSSMIELNQVFGIRCILTQNVEIKESQFKHNIYGIYSGNCSPLIFNNDLESNKYGIILIGSDNATIADNWIKGNPPPQAATPTLYGMWLGFAQAGVLIYENNIEQHDQGGIFCISGQTQAQITGNKIHNNIYYGILSTEYASPIVRWCTLDSNKAGIQCEDYSYPDLGTESNHGYNSILMGNWYWIANLNPDPQDSIKAELNWWGTDSPDRYKWKFLGLVDYNPWLPGPPEEGGGSQSAGIIKPTLTFALYAPKPNPAKREVRIAYSLPIRCKSELIIWDVSGRIITKTTDEKDAGNYEYLWNGKDQRGKEVPNGIYLVRLKAGNNLQTQKVALAR